MTEAAAPPVHFKVLGSLEIWVSGERLRLGGPIQERVLVSLLLEPGRVVPVTRLVAAAWDGEPPTTAAHQVRKAVADLRRRIPGGSALIVTDGPGYRGAVEDEQLDLSLFARHTALARGHLAAGASRDAADALRLALALWRGPVMAGDGGPTIGAAATALEERRITAAEQLFDLRLAAGEAGELIGDLRELVAGYPLRETLRGQLMLALYRSGRSAEALEEYGRVRELLADELGIDPGPQLAKLYDAMLCDSADLAAPERPAGSASVPAPVTSPAPGPGGNLCTLPYDLADFTGREDELARLLRAAEESTRNGTRIIAVDGMGGCGKTSLAVRAAHRLAETFPDGRLCFNLRGFSPGEEPLAPVAVLGSLLRTVGVPDQQIPEDEGGRAALWRATLTDKRLLILLDNALDSAQVMPLLPASAGCLAVVTSRARLVDLDGAEWISLGVYPPGDSAVLLSETLGEQRAAAEPEAAAELAELCGHLPLALRIASARLRNRPRWTVRYLADRLRDETRRLGELSSGERSVAATIQLSYQAMEERQRTAFRLLGRHPGADVDVHSSAALLGWDLRDTEDVLERLLDVHLVQQHEMGLYSLHDLVRSFALSLHTADTRAADRGAVERLLAYYVDASDEACAVLFPGRVSHPATRAAAPAGPVAELPALSDVERAGAWFDREYPALMSAVVVAQRQDLHGHAVQLARNVLFFLNLRSYFEAYQRVAHLAVHSARRLGAPVPLRTSLSNLASAHWKLGRFRDGLSAAQEALDLSRSAGDRHGEAVSLDQLGLLHSCVGDLHAGRDHLRRSLGLHTNPLRKAMALCNLSTVCDWLGQYEAAVAAAQEAVALHRAGGDDANEIPALNDLATAHLDRGAPEAAMACLDRAVQLGDESRMPEDLAVTFALTAAAGLSLGRPERTSAYAERALELAHAKGTLMRRSQVENLVGRFHQRCGDAEQALELHTSAFRWADTIGYRIEVARALQGIALATAASGDAAAAQVSQRRADEVFERLRIPVAHRR